MREKTFYYIVCVLILISIAINVYNNSVSTDYYADPTTSVTDKPKIDISQFEKATNTVMSDVSNIMKRAKKEKWDQKRVARTVYRRFIEINAKMFKNKNTQEVTNKLLTKVETSETQSGSKKSKTRVNASKKIDSVVSTTNPNSLQRIEMMYDSIIQHYLEETKAPDDYKQYFNEIWYKVKQAVNAYGLITDNPIMKK